MRTLLILLSLFLLCVKLCAQVVQIEYNGDLLSQDEREKIEKMLLHEAEFYSQFGMPDTLTVVQLFVFEKEEAALEYLKSLGVTAAIPRSVTGLYIAAQQKIIYAAFTTVFL